mgnify:CR=1 FL=1
MKFKVGDKVRFSEYYLSEFPLERRFKNCVFTILNIDWRLAPWRPGAYIKIKMFEDSIGQVDEREIVPVGHILICQ